MKKIFTALACLTMSIVVALPAFGQAADLQFSSATVDGQYCATVQIASADGVPFEIGSSSILFTYNESALGFSTYASENFDGTSICSEIPIPLHYSSHGFDGSTPGIVNLTIVYTNTEALLDQGCPSIEGCWVDVATICFDVLDATATGDLTFSTSDDLISFNSDATNDGTNQVPEGTNTDLDEAVDGSSDNCADSALLISAVQGDNGSLELIVTDSAGCDDIVDNGDGSSVADDDGDGVVILDGFVEGDTYSFSVFDQNGCTSTIGGTYESTAGPCDDNGGDVDGDGVCADVDCDDADESIGAAQDAGTSCDDGDATTYDDVVGDDGCSCAGIPFDCTEALANVGDGCDDGDALTSNDAILDDCTCAGEVDPNYCPDLALFIGDDCDDGDATTINATVQDDCSCGGGEANPDYCADLALFIGDDCDDNNDETNNDAVNADCVCEGSIAPENPIAFDVNFECDGQTSLSDFVITVTGGSEEVNSLYTFTGDANVEHLYAEGGIIVALDAIADGSTIEINVTDSQGNEGSLVYGPVGCVKCAAVSVDDIATCGETSVSANVTLDIPNASAGVNFASLIIVSDADGNEYYSGTDADFNLPADMAAGAYTITVITAQDQDEDGMPDETDACYVSSQTTGTLTVGEPISISTALGECDEDNTYNVTVTISGGSGSYDVVTEPASVTTAMAGESFTVSGDAGEGTFTVAVDASDANCSSSVAQEFTCGEPQAIELVEFTGEVVTAGNFLTWTTGSEIDNDYFNVERSFNGTSFETITTINGAGNSNTSIDYDYMDTTAPDGLNYYRLTQVDFDGTSTTSDIVLLNRVSVISTVVFDVSPMPVETVMNVSFDRGIKENVTVKVYDVLGKLITSFDADSGLIEYNTVAMRTGIYFMTIEAGDDVFTKKFVKK